MIELLEKYARRVIKEGLKRCTDRQQMLFKRMYARGNLDKPIDAVVDDMPIEKLDCAMDQVSRTLAKNVAKGGE